MATTANQKKFHIFLIKPSKYDPSGYVLRYFKGVLPSNTLSCLSSLTYDAVRRGALPDDVTVYVHTLDETVQRINVKKIAGYNSLPGSKALICFVGVQTNMFARAYDLAMSFAAHGLKVMIGGFHVSGVLRVSNTIPDDFKRLMSAGVTLVNGEVEDVWHDLLSAAWNDKLLLRYDIEAKPDLAKRPIPYADHKYRSRFIDPTMATIDCGRGCPFNCSFCTVINVQGRLMRTRDPGHIIANIKENLKHNVNFYFFTDDNFSRNPNWETIFDGLYELKRQGNKITFIMQVDTLSYRIPRFVEKAGLAGCTQVFIGMESLNVKNLEAAGKKQNMVSDMRSLFAAWHNAGVSCHVGYIIGFPNDTYASVMRDVDAMKKELEIDQVSFFILTPLPGSRDHLEKISNGASLAGDTNLYDTFNVVTEHPLMTSGEWSKAYHDAWEHFYSFDHMRRSLLRASRITYWSLFKYYIWYRSALSEGNHPMISGFGRVRRRNERRPSFPRESRVSFWGRQVKSYAGQFVDWIKLFFEFEALWLLTWRRSYSPSPNEVKQRQSWQWKIKLWYPKPAMLRTASAVLSGGLKGTAMWVREPLYDLWVKTVERHNVKSWKAKVKSGVAWCIAIVRTAHDLAWVPLFAFDFIFSFLNPKLRF